MAPFLSLISRLPARCTRRRAASSATRSSPYGAALALESWLRSTGGFSYTQHPPRVGRRSRSSTSSSATKRGYCQHFAGAMALMLRYLGIPSRVAEGFISGTYDPKTQTWTVTDHDAHAWVEVWFARYGWLPFDPTPGRGSLSAAVLGLVARLPPAEARGHRRRVAASLLNTAALHQDLGFGDKDPGAAFLGTDIRPHAGRPAGRSASSSGAAASASCSRSCSRSSSRCSLP